MKMKGSALRDRCVEAQMSGQQWQGVQDTPCLLAIDTQQAVRFRTVQGSLNGHVAGA